jgi:hypothetical protein
LREPLSLLALSSEQAMPLDPKWKLRDLGEDVIVEVTRGLMALDDVGRSSWELSKLLGRGRYGCGQRPRSVLLEVHRELFGNHLSTARRDDAYEIEMLRRDLESAVRAGWLVLRRTRRPVAIIPLDPGEPASLGPEDQVATPDDWIQVMLFDSAGNPMPSDLEPAAEPAFDVTLASGKVIQDSTLMNGFGRVPSIEPGAPSACSVAFPNMATRPPAKLDDAGPVGDPKIDPSLVRGSLLGPTLVTRRELANPQPAVLDATNVYQLRRRRAEVIECEHFNEGGAVFLPGDSPALLRPGADRVQGIDVLKACLLRARDVSLSRILVIGHDAASQERADSVLHLLTGNREKWATVSNTAGTEADEREILRWVALQKGWACEPGADVAPAAREFQRAYNAERSGSIRADGTVDESTWGAFFDLYIEALQPGRLPPAPRPQYPIGDETTRTGPNAGRPRGSYPFVVFGTNGPGNAPITIAKYGAGSEVHYTDLQPLNPQYRIGEEPEFVGQTLNVPWDWAPKLVLAGYAVEQDPSDPPDVPPDAPGVDWLPRPGPRAIGLGGDYLIVPYSLDRRRRAAARHVEVLFFDEELVGDASDVYDPRETTLVYLDPRGDVSRLADLVIQFPIPLSDASALPHVYALESEDGAIRKTRKLASDARANAIGNAEIYFDHVPDGHKYRLRCEEPEDSYDVFSYRYLSMAGPADSDDTDAVRQALRAKYVDRVDWMEVES